MNLSIELRDSNGTHLKLGDVIELFDWGGKQESIGRATLCWDADEGRISTEPRLVEDPHDFWRKAMPRCKLVKRH